MPTVTLISKLRGDRVDTGRKPVIPTGASLERNAPTWKLVQMKTITKEEQYGGFKK